VTEATDEDSNCRRKVIEKLYHVARQVGWPMPSYCPTNVIAKSQAGVENEVVS
jgi:hypothetical protein